MATITPGDPMPCSFGNLTHQIPCWGGRACGHGGMVNVGEYNPCTPSTCGGSRMHGTLLSGQFHPLNDQLFIRFEGRWGSLPVSRYTSPIAVELPDGPCSVDYYSIDDLDNVEEHHALQLALDTSASS
jgi:hypothetical protein